MRVLMLSKAAVVGIYQRKLEEIAARGVELLALVPPSWRDERGAMPLERAYTDGYRLETLPIVLNGSFHLHFYRELGGWMTRFRPQIVHIDEEMSSGKTHRPGRERANSVTGVHRSESVTAQRCQPGG